MRNTLYEIRKKQLIEEQKLDEKIKKKQKRLELVKKLKTFRKK